MIAIASALVAAALPAATPPPPAGATRSIATMKALGMSDAGIKVLRQQSAPDPDARALLAKRQAMHGQLATAAAATPFDVDGFAALLREAASLDAAVRARSAERIVTTLKALPAADRSIYAKMVFGDATPRPPGDAPAPPAAKP